MSSQHHKSAADIFTNVGRALYPDHEDWLTPLADALNVKRPTLRDIRRGHTYVRSDHGIVADLLELVVARRDALVRAEVELRDWMKAALEYEPVKELEYKPVKEERTAKNRAKPKK